MTNLREEIYTLLDELQVWYDGDDSPTSIENIGFKLEALIQKSNKELLERVRSQVIGDREPVLSAIDQARNILREQQRQALDKLEKEL